MRAGRPAVAVLAPLLAAALPLAAQDAAPTVAPDRPDACDGIQIVPTGHFQVEGGATGAWAEGRRDLAVGELTVRIPFSSRIETRLQLLDVDWTSESESARGLLSPAVDLKWRLHDGEETDFGLIAGTSLPVGSGEFRSAHLLPYATLSLDQALGGNLSVTLNLGLAASIADRATHGRATGGASFALQASPRLSLFLEGYAWGSAGPEVHGAQLVDGGVELLVSRRVMLDARVGAVFGRGANGAVAGLGAAALF